MEQEGLSVMDRWLQSFVIVVGWMEWNSAANKLLRIFRSMKEVNGDALGSFFRIVQDNGQGDSKVGSNRKRYLFIFRVSFQCDQREVSLDLRITKDVLFCNMKQNRSN